MKKGISAIVSVVLLIAISVIAAVSVYFWSSGLVTKQPTPSTTTPISAVPLDNQGHVAVANLGNKPLTLSKLNSTAGVECDFGGTVTIQPGGQAVCTIPPKEGKIVLYGSNTGSTEIQFSNIAEVTVTTSPGFSTSSVSQTSESEFEEGYFDNVTTASPEIRLAEVSAASVINMSDFDFLGASGDYIPMNGDPAGIAYGDLNNDGEMDIVVSSYAANSNAGKVYVFFGPLSGSIGASSADVVISGTTYLAGPTGELGDVNGDGEDDLVYGELCPTTDCYGKVYIAYGPISSGSYVPSDIANATFTGENANDYLGYSLFTHDVNGDGKVDILAGAEGYPQGNGEGRVYLVYGKEFSGDYTISSVANATFNGSSEDYFGYSPAAFGDFNGDGNVDIAFGNPQADTVGGSDTGQVLVYYGPLSGDYQPSDANVTINASIGNSKFGYDVYTYDVNGDGKDDLLVSSPDFYVRNTKLLPATNKHYGAGFVFYSPLHSMTVSVNYTLHDWLSNANITFVYDTEDEAFGSAIRAAQLKGNSTYIIVGWKNMHTSSGRVVMYIDPSAGIYEAEDANVTVTHSTSDTSEHLGSALEVGDINGDGITDLVIGAYAHSTDRGRVYLINGGRPLTYYRTSGKYYSKVFDLNHLSNLTYVTWTSDEPTGTDLTIELRIGNASDIDNSSGYDVLNVAGTNVSKGSISLGPGTKAQYIAYFNTSDTSKTPVLYDIQLTYKPLYTNVTYTINYASGLKWVALNRSDGTLVANETVSNCDTFYTNTEEVSTAYSYTVIYKGCDDQTKTYAVS